MLATLDHRLDCGGIAKIRSVIQGLRARQFLKLDADAFDLGRVAEAVDHHARTFGRQRLGDRQPDA